MGDPSAWLALMVGVCPSAGLARSICECPQCSADDDEENAILRYIGSWALGDFP
jgi:hypothetical protein